MTTLQFWGALGQSRRIHEIVDQQSYVPVGATYSYDSVLPVDIQENEESVTISASVPGLAKCDIHVSVEDRWLSISTHPGVVEESQPDEYVVRERRAASCGRRIRLSGRLDEAGARSRCTDGVLTVTIPVRDEAKLKRIEVDVD